VETIHDLSGVRTVLYTKIGQNIDRLSAKTLAELAVHSVPAAPRGHDGITSLMDAKKSGIETPLMRDYESEILRQTGAKTLEGCAEPTQVREPVTLRLPSRQALRTQT
jgi:hypothetical protein